MKKTHLIAIIMGGAVLGCPPAIAEDCDFNPGAQLKKLEVKPSATCTLTDAKVIGRRFGWGTNPQSLHY